MARKRKEETPASTNAAGDKVSPDVPVRTRKTPRKTDEVKVVGGRVVKKAPPKAPSKPATKTKTAATAKPAARAKTTGKASGDTTVRSTVELSAKEIKALQAGSLHGLDERQAKFIDLWLVTQNATQAYQDAGYECKSDAVAAAGASRLLRRVKDHPYTQAKRAELFARTEEITGRVIERIYGAAMADPRELVEYVYRCCRCCHGLKHKYQMTPRQMEERKDNHKRAVAEAKLEKRPPPKFDQLGGLGFDATRDPNPECPECNGQGLGQLILKDTRYMSPGALMLYGGVKPTKEGIEVKVVDQRPYLEMLGRIFNMNIEPAAPPVAVVDRAVLDEAYARGQAKTDAQRQQMAERAARIAALEDGGNA
ncbi:terminase small subunit [Pseudomonas gingeri]|uniref:terminase small subunit n=1 Tax=Pseudomonas gingeri TaxID=117681 RepID=UPI0015A1BA66|nr:terminase small subunit [Pseudomonas gingeri]